MWNFCLIPPESPPSQKNNSSEKSAQSREIGQKWTPGLTEAPSWQLGALRLRASPQPEASGEAPSQWTGFSLEPARPSEGPAAGLRPLTKKERKKAAAAGSPTLPEAERKGSASGGEPPRRVFPVDVPDGERPSVTVNLPYWLVSAAGGHGLAQTSPPPPPPYIEFVATPPS